MNDPIVASRSGETESAVILLVEDDVLVRLTTAELLRDGGYEVLEAVDAEEALAILATGYHVDLVMTDIRMPGDMDGLELTRTIKRSRPVLPVAIVSSHLTYDVAHEADRFVVKPFSPSQLLEAAAELIRPAARAGRGTPGAF